MVVPGSLQEGWFTAVNDLMRATPWLHAPARVFAEYGVLLFACLRVGSWWLARPVRDASSLAQPVHPPGRVSRLAAALWAPVGTLVAVGVNQPVVNAIGESRPVAVLPRVLTLVPHSADYGYPSDHGVTAGALATEVVLAVRPVLEPGVARVAEALAASRLSWLVVAAPPAAVPAAPTPGTAEVPDR